MGFNLKRSIKKAIKKPGSALLKGTTNLATGGLLTKQINKGVDKLSAATYGKSGLRKLYLDNQHLINNTALMAAGGALAPGLMMSLPGSGAALLAGAAGSGYMMDKKDKAKEKLKDQQIAAQAEKDAASGRVDDVLDDITNDPDSPATGGGGATGPYNGEDLANLTDEQLQKYLEFGSNDTSIGGGKGFTRIPITQDPARLKAIQDEIARRANPTPTDQAYDSTSPTGSGSGSAQDVDPELLDMVLGSTPLEGGAVNTGGTASKDQNDLISEAELQYKLQNENAEMSKTQRSQMLQEYADLISQQQNRILDENAPALYEDLNTRGLLRSSELGNAMGRERGKAAQILQENVGLQGLSDRDAYINALSGNTDNYLQGRSGAIQRRFSLEDFARQAKVAKDTGIALQPISTGTPSSKAGDAAMVSAGASVATAMKGK